MQTIEYSYSVMCVVGHSVSDHHFEILSIIKLIILKELFAFYGGDLEKQTCEYLCHII